ncbi:iap2 [Cyclophragma undans nucleopolyhedrovirus]|uniref:Iap2 n=1 Tax=Cyclophragma undans nucleopolyhedrovirus TaxID=1906244 RepID=A0A2U8UFG0_9ABAC|nr:iap2 [Cyclophragma undans nucleopolyhedrovirus]AWN01896.1 iap2 [Cyclophragma undans nucleopolyhedrovirus]
MYKFMRNKMASLELFNLLIGSTEGRFQTMQNMSLDNDLKRQLAKTGLFYYDNMLKCVGCNATMNKINDKLVKRHTFSEKCVSSTNALVFNEAMRRRSFASFKTCRRQFKSSDLVSALARRGYYSFGKPGHLKCAGCSLVFKYTTLEAAQSQQRHKNQCIFFDQPPALETKNFLLADFPPPRLYALPSAPKDDNDDITITTGVNCINQASECKICFEKEKSVCFMPCRHLATCIQFSRRCKRCCVCNAKIVHTIETLPQ